MHRQIAILTSPNQWFIPYAQILEIKIEGSKLFFDHKEIDETYTLVFILSYHSIIPKAYLQKHQHNIVIHASALPYGKGWAPLFWQILEGKKEIPFSMFEASKGVDDGDIYMQKDLILTGYELNAELRAKQADFTIQMCLEFLEHYETYKIPNKQQGEASFYPKRGALDSKLDVNKSIKEQFNLLRIAHNEDYPAFFELDGHRYILKIESKTGGGESVSLIDFVDLTLPEKAMILEWRNHPSVKAYMYNTNEISEEEHFGFIHALQQRGDKSYCVIQKDGTYIGVIDLNNISKISTKLGIYANPFLNQKGTGTLLMQTLIAYAFDVLKTPTLEAEVFAHNERAIHLYEKFGFQEKFRRFINEKEIICMELDNENR